MTNLSLEQLKLKWNLIRNKNYPPRKLDQKIGIRHMYGASRFRDVKHARQEKQGEDEIKCRDQGKF